MKYKIRYKEYVLKEKTADVVDTPEKVFDVLRGDYNPLQEEMYLLILDVKNNVIEKHLLARGGNSMMVITPAEIFRVVLLSGGSRFIVAHSHSSGDVSPSEEDIVFTRKTLKASEIMSTPLLDHIVFSAKEHYSFKKHGLI